MLKLHKINPMVRAIGTMGAVAALVGGITFAQLTSNVVALGPNSVGTASADLAIAPDTGGCTGATYGTMPVPGFNATNLTPTSSVTPINFCLQNNYTVPLSIEGYLDTNVSSAVASGDITLQVQCNTIGTKSDVLNTWYSTGEFFSAPLPAGATDTCTATIALSKDYSSTTGETVPSFNIDFQGTNGS